MTKERLPMRKVREILRLVGGLSGTYRDAACSLGVSLGIVAATVRQATDAGLDWPGVEALPDDAPGHRLYGSVPILGEERPRPDCAWLHTERHLPGVTLALLHLEYLERHLNGYRYTQFCEYYRQWLSRRRLSVRQVHRAGEKAFLDYAGKKPHLIDPATGVRFQLNRHTVLVQREHDTSTCPTGRPFRPGAPFGGDTSVITPSSRRIEKGRLPSSGATIVRRVPP